MCRALAKELVSAKRRDDVVKLLACASENGIEGA